MSDAENKQSPPMPGFRESCSKKKPAHLICNRFFSVPSQLLFLATEGKLDPTWTIETATDFFRATLSTSTWEHLTIERGWSQDQYCERMQWVIKRALLREA